MLPRSLSVLLLSSVILLQPRAASAAPPTIELVVPTYDYPQDGVTNTIGRAIANNGTIAGTIATPGPSGYERFANGRFSAPIEYLDSNITYVWGVNSSNVVCGSYLTNTTQIEHGFFYDNVAFTQYDVPGATNTNVQGINDAGDFCGYSYMTFLTENTPFVNVGGTLVTFTIPGVTAVFPTAVNNLGQVVGDFLDRRGGRHGFFRDADGTLIYPVDLPGSTTTSISGINDKGIMVGDYSDSVGTGNHAFVLKLPRAFISYDYPDPAASSLSFRGINNSGLITGSYHSDTDFSFHSFIARIVP